MGGPGNHHKAAKANQQAIAALEAELGMADEVLVEKKAKLCEYDKHEWVRHEGSADTWDQCTTCGLMAVVF